MKTRGWDSSAFLPNSKSLWLIFFFFPKAKWKVNQKDSKHQFQNKEVTVHPNFWTFSGCQSISFSKASISFKIKSHENESSSKARTSPLTSRKAMQGQGPLTQYKEVLNVKSWDVILSGHFPVFPGPDSSCERWLLPVYLCLGAYLHTQPTCGTSHESWGVNAPGWPSTNLGQELVDKYSNLHCP